MSFPPRASHSCMISESVIICKHLIRNVAHMHKSRLDGRRLYTCKIRQTRLAHFCSPNKVLGLDLPDLRTKSV